MNSFDTSMYDDVSRAELLAVIRAIREQYYTNGRFKQFWFLPSQMSNITLTEPVVVKWLLVLSNANLLYFYKPNNGIEFERSLALSQHRLGDNHMWGEQIFTPIISQFSASSSPIIALDIYDTDLDSLLENVSRKRFFGSIYVNDFGQFYYENIPLKNINNSPLRKAILGGFLSKDNHVLSTREIMDILKSFDEEDYDNDDKRNENLHKIRKNLFSVSQHKVNILSYKNGHRIDYYELISQE